MNRLEEIDRELAELRREFDDVEGRPTEIYTRIVGYYRSLKNWNKGKREEYDHRQTFAQLEAKAPVSDSLATAHESEMVAPESASTGEFDPAPTYLYFFRESCPNCPPVKQLLTESHLQGTSIDVDTEEGMQLAIEHQILATPTVVLLSEEGTVVEKVAGAEQLQEAFAGVS